MTAVVVLQGRSDGLGLENQRAHDARCVLMVKVVDLVPLKPSVDLIDRPLHILFELLLQSLKLVVHVSEVFRIGADVPFCLGDAVLQACAACVSGEVWLASAAIFASATAAAATAVASIVVGFLGVHFFSAFFGSAFGAESPSSSEKVML